MTAPQNMHPLDMPIWATVEPAPELKDLLNTNMTPSILLLHRRQSRPASPMSGGVCCCASKVNAGKWVPPDLEIKMASDVKCCICGEKSTTANLKTGYLGYCSKCNLYWHSKCHTVKQCPHCSRYT